MKTPEDRVTNRLNEIEAAIADLRPIPFGVYKARELKPGESAARRYRNRLQHTLLLLNHLQADVNRLARRRGLPKQIVNDFVESSQCVEVCRRAANTHKHGLGGHTGNATMPTSFITVVKEAEKAPASDEEDAIIVGMLISDAEAGSFTSQALIETAARDWVEFLRNEFELDYSEWLSRCFPPPDGPVIPLRPEGNDAVPLGSRSVLEVPRRLRGEMVDAVRRERDDA